MARVIVSSTCSSAQLLYPTALPERQLQRGQVGTVVEELAPDVFEVEFTDNNGRAFAGPALQAKQPRVLHCEPAGMA